jgi:NTE family protein
MLTKKSIALVLSGGGARGLAHIGILKAIGHLKVEISSIGGCSMGGLIASLYAIGIPIQEIENIARKYSTTREIIKLVDLTPHHKGIVLSQKLRTFLSRFIDETIDIRDARIPLFMNAVNLSIGREEILDRGNLLDAILSTTAVPGFISPFESKDRILADGSVVNNLPVSIMREKTGQPIVAVDVHQSLANFPFSGDLSNPYPKSKFPDFLREYYLAEIIRIRMLTDLNLLHNPPDLLLSPEIDPNITSFLGFQRVNELIAAGESVTLENKEKILNLIN